MNHTAERPSSPPRAGRPSFADLSEQPDFALLPWLDRPDVDEGALTADQLAWWRNGVVIKRGLFSPDLLGPYIRRRMESYADGMARHWAGWDSPSPYEHVPELRDVCLHPPLMTLLESLIGEPMMLHLNLTGWVSTERDWHQDDYLNPPGVDCWYAAVWIALGHIHDGCGPFEYIPGSHRWPLLRRDLVRRWMSPEELARRGAAGVETWPKDSERLVVPALEAEIAARRAVPSRFLAEMGDVLVWHGRLLHRGTKATSAEYWRPAVIAHYSGVNHRADMPNRAIDVNGFTYAVFGTPLS